MYPHETHYSFFSEMLVLGDNWVVPGRSHWLFCWLPARMVGPNPFQQFSPVQDSYLWWILCGILFCTKQRTTSNACWLPLHRWPCFLLFDPNQLGTFFCHRSDLSLLTRSRQHHSTVLHIASHPPAFLFGFLNGCFFWISDSPIILGYRSCWFLEFHFGSSRYFIRYIGMSLFVCFLCASIC